MIVNCRPNTSVNTSERADVAICSIATSPVTSSTSTQEWAINHRPFPICCSIVLENVSPPTSDDPGGEVTGTRP